MQFAFNETIKIQGILATMSEPAFVDAVEYLVSSEPKAAIAVFKCEFFGDCVVSRVLGCGTDFLSEADLRTMASIANDELDRIISANGWGAMTDHPVDLGHTDIPEGFSMEFRPLLN